MKPAMATYCLFLGIGFATASAVPPTIDVSWSNPDPPVLNFDYRVSTIPPASPDFPDVELITGSLTWQIWSTDADNPDNIGDIGVISSPHPNNFAVAIRNDSEPFLRGARDVKAITLVPSSLNNYSNITEARTTGTLQDDLTVRADSLGVGGEVEDLQIGGDVTADMTIHKLTFLSVAGTVSGTIVIDELVGLVTFIDLSGNLNIGTATVNALLRIFQPISGSLSVSEMAGEFSVFFPSGVSQTGVLTFGEILSFSPWQIGTGTPGINQVAGTIRFLGGIPAGLTVDMFTELASTGVIDLNGVGVGGLLLLHGGGNGTIVNGGTISGLVKLGREADGNGPFTEFTGTAGFDRITTGDITASDLPGTIELTGGIEEDGGIATTGDVAGTISIDGSADGSINIGGNIAGNVLLLGGGSGTVDGGTVTGTGYVALGSALARSSRERPPLPASPPSGSSEPSWPTSTEQSTSSGT